MSAMAGPPEQSTAVGDKLGMSRGLVVQELGWDTDVDDDLRIAIEDSIDAELVEDAMEAVDMVVLWWRDDDGDLVDGLVEAMTDLTANGQIWLMTPKIGRDRLRRRRRHLRGRGHRGPLADQRGRDLGRLVGQQAGPAPGLTPVSRR